VPARRSAGHPGTGARHRPTTQGAHVVPSQVQVDGELDQVLDEVLAQELDQVLDRQAQLSVRSSR